MPGTEVDVDALIVLLAGRLAAIAPAGFHVSVAAGMLRISCDEGRFPGQLGNYDNGEVGVPVRDNFGCYGETDADNIVGAAVQALDVLQDYVSEATHDPWPGQRSQPLPHARISGMTLQLGYGEPPGVILACEAVTLAEIWGGRAAPDR